MAFFLCYRLSQPPKFERTVRYGEVSKRLDCVCECDGCLRCVFLPSVRAASSSRAEHSRWVTRAQGVRGAPTNPTTASMGVPTCRERALDLEQGGPCRMACRRPGPHHMETRCTMDESTRRAPHQLHRWSTTSVSSGKHVISE